MALRRDWPQPKEILDHYLHMKEIHKRLDQLVPNLLETSNRFHLKSAEEIKEIFKQMYLELEHQSVMMLMASIEATFQVDVLIRKKVKKQDRLSTALRKLEKQKRKDRQRVEIEEILNIWTDEIGFKNAIGELKQVIAFRHWLAHGRYWVQKSGLHDLDVFETWRRWEAVRERIQRSHRFPLFGD
jgi:hypothetical protein